MEKKRRTEIAELGEFGLIDLLTSGFEPTNDSTLRAAGDDAAVILPPAGEARALFDGPADGRRRFST